MTHNTKNKFKIIAIALLTLIILFILFVYFAFRPSIIQSSKSINNFSTELIYDEALKQDVFILSGNFVDSALWIDSYNIKYRNDEIFIEIKRTLAKTGNSSLYFIKFIVPKDANKIYLGDTEILWER